MQERIEPIGFLLAMAHRRNGLIFRSLLTPYRLTPRQYGILARLREEDGLSLAELAARLYADATSLCRTLYTMEKKKLLKRVRDQQDHRVVHLFLGDAGRDVMDRLHPLVERHGRWMLEPFTPTEIDTLRAALRKLIANLSTDRLRSA